MRNTNRYLPLAAASLALLTALGAPSRTSAADTKSSRDALHRRPFGAARPELSARRTLDKRLPGMTIWHVEMPSPDPIGNDRVDRIYGSYFEPWIGSDAAVIVLPIAAGPDLTLEKTFAGYLALRGIAAFVMPLPYQHERNDGKAPNVLRRMGSDRVLVRFFQQAVADCRQVRSFLVGREGVRPERVGVMGISLGGYVAALAYGADEQFRAAACLLAGGDLAAVIWNDSPESHAIKRALEAKGYDLARTRELLRPVDPLTYARPERGDGLLLINAIDDEVVPRACAWRLREAWGEPHFETFPGDHYSVAVFLPVVLEQTARHFRRHLLGR